MEDTINIRWGYEFEKIREKYTMGIVSESVSVTCMLFKTLRSLSEEEWDWVVMTSEEVQDGKPLVRSPSEDPRPEWKVQREKDEFSPAPERSQGKIYEEDVLESSVTSEEGIIKFLKKDAAHTSDSSGHGICEKGIFKSVDEDTTHARASSGHSIDMLD